MIRAQIPVICFIFPTLAHVSRVQAALGTYTQLPGTWLEVGEWVAVITQRAEIDQN